MKKTLLTLSAILLTIGSFAQSPFWTTLLNVNYPQTSMATNLMDVVNTNVIWTAGVYNTGRQHEFYSRSINGGTSFTSGNVFPDTLKWQICSMEGIDANNAWVCAFNRVKNDSGVIYHTINGGVNWTNGGNASMFTHSVSFADWCAFLTPSVGVVMGDQNPNSAGKHEIWRTVDAGTTWTMVPAGNIPPVTGATDAGLTGSYTTYSTNCLWYGTGAGRVFRSTDAGVTWSASTTGATGNVTDLAFTSASNGLCIGYTGTSTFGLYRTTDGGATWASVPVTNTTGKRAVVAVPGTNYYTSCSFTNNAAAPSTISVSYDAGTTWNNWGGTNIIGYITMGWADNTTGFASVFSSSTTASIGGMYKYTSFPLDVNNTVSNFIPTALNTYPNPSNGLVTIMVPAAKQGADIIITDLLGNVVYKDRTTTTTTEDRTLNLQHLAKGVYNLNIVISGDKYHEKIVIE